MAVDFRSVALVRLTAMLAGMCVAGTLLAAHAAPDPGTDQKTDEKVAQKPGDDKRPSLSLKVTAPLGFSPLRVRASVDVRGGADDYADFYCPAIEWDWGDGTSRRSPRTAILRSRQERNPPPLQRRATFRQAGFKRLVPPEAEDRRRRLAPAPTSRSARGVRDELVAGERRPSTR